MSAILGSPLPITHSQFNFNPAEPIARDQQSALVIRVFGGPVAYLQALVADVNNVIRNGVGFDGMGAPLGTATTGAAQWAFLTNGCAGGYAKWRVTVQASAADLATYHVIEEIWQGGQCVRQATVPGTLPDGHIVQSFVNGVLIA